MIKPGLTLHRLRLFLAVLDQGGVARAAAKENISQPAVSEHLRGLEEHFGVRLVERVGRGVSPTSAARQIEPYVRQVVHLLRSAEQLASDLQGIRTGTLTIGASSTPGTYLLPHALGRFRAQHPAVGLQLRIRNSSQVEKLVTSGEVELGIVGDSGGLEESIIADPWLEDELIVLVNSQHLFARRRSVAPAALVSESYIAREPGSSTRRVAESLFEKRGVSLTPSMELGSTEAIREAVAAGLGIALVSKYAILPSDRRVVAVRLEGVAWRRRFTIIRRSGAPLGPAATRFREVLLEGAYPETTEAAPRKAKRRS